MLSLTVLCYHKFSLNSVHSSNRLARTSNATLDGILIRSQEQPDDCDASPIRIADDDELSRHIFARQRPSMYLCSASAWRDARTNHRARQVERAERYALSQTNAAHHCVVARVDAELEVSVVHSQVGTHTPDICFAIRGVMLMFA